MEFARNRVSSQDACRNSLSIENVQAATQSLIDDRPVAVIFAVFGLGLAVGTAAGMMIGDCMSDRTQVSYNADSISRQVMDSLSRMVPDVIARHFQA